jgi:hypothetical protein
VAQLIHLASGVDPISAEVEDWPQLCQLRGIFFQKNFLFFKFEPCEHVAGAIPTLQAIMVASKLKGFEGLQLNPGPDGQMLLDDLTKKFENQDPKILVLEVTKELCKDGVRVARTSRYYVTVKILKGQFDNDNVLVFIGPHKLHLIPSLEYLQKYSKGGDLEEKMLNLVKKKLSWRTLDVVKVYLVKDDPTDPARKNQRERRAAARALYFSYSE